MNERATVSNWNDANPGVIICRCGETFYPGQPFIVSLIRQEQDGSYFCNSCSYAWMPKKAGTE